MCKLILNVGPMFSGKTSALQQQGKKHLTAEQKVVFLKPQFDNRYSDTEIVSHDGIKVDAVNITDTIAIPEVKFSDIILIDEVQFLPLSIVDEIWTLLGEGKTIYCSGLDLDYRGKGFETTMKLMAVADVVNKYTAICECCGADASMTGKRSSNDKIVELGSKETYYSTCKTCFFESLQ